MERALSCVGRKLRRCLAPAERIAPLNKGPDGWGQIQGSTDALAAGPQRYRLCSGPPKQADAVTNGQWLVSLNVRIVGHWPFVTVHPIAERRSGALAYLR